MFLVYKGELCNTLLHERME